MTGKSFVGAIVMWLWFLLAGFIIAGIGVVGSVWVLVVAFGLVWACLTLRWTWLLMTRDGDSA